MILDKKYSSANEFCTLDRMWVECDLDDPS